VLAQIGLSFSSGPFLVIAAFALSYVAAVACGFIAIAFLLSPSPRLELTAIWISFSGLAVMGAWFGLVLHGMPGLLLLNVTATIAGAAPLILCAIVLRFAIVRRWTVRHCRTRR
jgi:hypothetical protein